LDGWNEEQNPPGKPIYASGWRIRIKSGAIRVTMNRLCLERAAVLTAQSWTVQHGA
jgi:hypothetical protein